MTSRIRDRMRTVTIAALANVTLFVPQTALAAQCYRYIEPAYPQFNRILEFATGPAGGALVWTLWGAGILFLTGIIAGEKQGRNIGIVFAGIAVLFACMRTLSRSLIQCSPVETALFSSEKVDRLLAIVSGVAIIGVPAIVLSMLIVHGIHKSRARAPQADPELPLLIEGRRSAVKIALTASLVLLTIELQIGIIFLTATALVTAMLCRAAPDMSWDEMMSRVGREVLPSVGISTALAAATVAVLT